MGAPTSRVGLRVLPNPLRHDGVIEWGGQQSGITMLKLYDAQGRLVLFHHLDPSARQARWTDVLGRRALSSGVYFLELAGPAIAPEVTRVVLLR